MAVLVESPPARRRARPDPLPVREDSLWARHAPWAATLVALIVTTALVPREPLGWIACGAALLAVLTPFALARLRQTCLALHLTAGLVLVAAWEGAGAAGGFVPALGVVVVGALAARAVALGVQAGVAPLAGALPWQFRNAYRRAAVPLGLAGLGAGVATVLVARDPAVRIVAVALLPLALRTYNGTLLARNAMRALWCYAVAMHLALLGTLVPIFGTGAAAWSMVAAETLLFAGSSLIIARRTGMTPLPFRTLAIGVAAAMLLAASTIPGSPEWPFLAAIVGGVAAGALLFPKEPIRS